MVLEPYCGIEVEVPSDQLPGYLANISSMRIQYDIVVSKAVEHCTLESTEVSNFAKMNMKCALDISPIPLAKVVR